MAQFNKLDLTFWEEDKILPSSITTLYSLTFNVCCPSVRAKPIYKEEKRVLTILTLLLYKKLFFSAKKGTLRFLPLIKTQQSCQR